GGELRQAIEHVIDVGHALVRELLGIDDRERARALDVHVHALDARTGHRDLFDLFRLGGGRRLRLRRERVEHEKVAERRDGEPATDELFLIHEPHPELFSPRVRDNDGSSRTSNIIYDIHAYRGTYASAFARAPGSRAGARLTRRASTAGARRSASR